MERTFWGSLGWGFCGIVLWLSGSVNRYHRKRRRYWPAALSSYTFRSIADAKIRKVLLSPPYVSRVVVTRFGC
ncbi:hypothetical protein EMIT0215P_220047 [Pseudomonas serboccidentalis]